MNFDSRIELPWQELRMLFLAWENVFKTFFKSFPVADYLFSSNWKHYSTTIMFTIIITIFD